VAMRLELGALTIDLMEGRVTRIGASISMSTSVEVVGRLPSGWYRRVKGREGRVETNLLQRRQRRHVDHAKSFELRREQ
jgi:hypothetical protein